MTGHGSKFKRKMEEAIAALLTNRNVEEAASAIQVSTKTLLRWMKEPEFDKAYRSAKRSTFKQAVGRLQQAAPAAVTTMLKTIVDPNAPASVRIRAAECILNHAIKAIELEDIDARLTELERSTDPSKK